MLDRLIPGPEKDRAWKSTELEPEILPTCPQCQLGSLWKSLHIKEECEMTQRPWQGKKGVCRGQENSRNEKSPSISKITTHRVWVLGSGPRLGAGLWQHCPDSTLGP